MIHPAAESLRSATMSLGASCKAKERCGSGTHLGARLGTLTTLFPTGRVSSTDGKEVSTSDAWNRYGGNGHPHYYSCGWQSHAHDNTASGLELPPLWDDAALTSHAEPKGG